MSLCAGQQSITPQTSSARLSRCGLALLELLLCCRHYLHANSILLVLLIFLCSLQVVSNPNAEASCGCGSSFAPKA